MSDSASASNDLAWVHAVRLVAGEVPADEATRLRSWLDGSPEGQRILEEAEAAWRAARPLAAVPHPAWDTDAAVRRFQAARAADSAAPTARAPWTSPSWGRVVRRSAAAAAAMLAVAVLWRERTHEAGPVADRAMRAVVAMANPAGAAPRTMRLPDGSSVTLAPGSALEASRGYGTSHREVRLTGEGAFAVMPGARPFRVLLRGTVVEDVSTAFLVRPDGDGILVAVSEGAVIAGAGRDTLRQGMAAQVDSGGELRRLGAGVVERELAWTRGALVFVDAPLGEIAARVSRWSGRAVTVAPVLSRRKVTVTFDGERVDAMVQVLAATVGARAEATNDGWRMVRIGP